MIGSSQRVPHLATIFNFKTFAEKNAESMNTQSNNLTEIVSFVM
jgi:hypothetical protein